MVPKSAGLVKEHTFRYVHKFVIDFVPLTNDKHQVLSLACAKHFVLEAY